jgi:hypothetical protein
MDIMRLQALAPSTIFENDHLIESWQREPIIDLVGRRSSDFGYLFMKA